MSSITNPRRSSTVAGAGQEAVFGFLRIVFGLIWVLNTWFQANSGYVDHLFLQSFDAGINGQPAWLAHYTQAVVHAIQAMGPPRVALATVVIDGLLALSLLTGLWLRFFVWVGVVYNLFMWSTVGGLGGPYTERATDPGPRIVYALAFFFVLVTRSWSRLSVASGGARVGRSDRFYGLARALFGLLWGFDAFLKWQPYFLQHAIGYLSQSQQGQPAWIVAYIQFFIDLIHLVNPLAFALFAAVAESLIALSLLFKVGMDFMLPLGFVYALGLWTTAEGWGGPYGSSDVWGTANIYCLVFLYLMAMYPPFGLWKGSDRPPDPG